MKGKGLSRGLGLALLALLMACLGPQTMPGQQVTAAINGLISDPSGAPVGGATVVVTDLDRQTAWRTQSNGEGLYMLPRLPLGSYGIRVEAKGFQSAVHPPVLLEMNQTARVNFSMTLGQVSETIQVTGQAPLLQSEATQVSTIINAAAEVALPLATRNYVQLTLLAPGSVNVDPSSMSSAKTPSGGNTGSAQGRPFINGNRDQADNFILDGMDNNEWGANYVGYTPSVDAIEEFNLITSNASAEFGNFQGGVISTSIKSGTNQYHGDLFEFFRNNVLNANSWSNNWQNIDRAPVRWNMFGGTIGGPVVKNKLFFFGDYQGQRFDHPSNSGYLTVFTKAEQAGDFSQLSTALYQRADWNIYGAKVPVANNLFPASQISPVALNLFKSSLYTQPINSNAKYNYINTSNSHINGDQGDSRLDYNISDKDRVFGRYSQEYLTAPSLNSDALVIGKSDENTMQNGVVGWTHTFGPSIVNEARAGVNHILINVADSPGQLGDFASQVLGIPGGNDHGPGLFRMVMTDQTVNSFGDYNYATREGSTAFQGEDALIISKGKHIIHTGVQLWHTRQNLYYAGNTGAWGYMQFTGRYTGASASDFLVGHDFALGRGYGGATGTTGQRSNILGAYVQDDYKLTSELTLNLGLRYENHLPLTEAHNRLVNYDLWTGQPQFAGQPNEYGNNSLYHPYNLGLDFQPRLGLAWTPKQLGGKTVIRAGYTLSSFFEGTGINLRMSMNPPLQIPEYNYSGWNGGFQSTMTASAGMMQPTDPYSGAIIRAWDPTVRPAAVQQWNFTVQHQFSNSLTLQAGYVGQHGTHLIIPMPYSDKKLNSDGTISPSPYFAGNPDLVNEITGIQGTASVGNQKYNSLQTVLQKRMSNGLQAQIAYTYSKCMTDSIGFFNGGGQAGAQNNNFQDLYNPKADWGPCLWDAKHVLTAYSVYELPFGKGKKFGSNLNKITQAVAGNWQVGAILSLRGGFPLTPGTAWSYDPGTGAGNWADIRPNCIAPTTYPKTNVSTGGLQWFDPSAFVVPQSGYGTCGVGTIRSPGLKNLDFSLQKQFALTETKKLEFRAEALNLTNTPIFNQPTLDIGTNFGVVGSAQGERNLQLALKLYF